MNSLLGSKSKDPLKVATVLHGGSSHDLIEPDLLPAWIGFGSIVGHKNLCICLNFLK